MSFRAEESRASISDVIAWKSIAAQGGKTISKEAEKR
jgi:hypothetical protein